MRFRFFSALLRETADPPPGPGPRTEPPADDPVEIEGRLRDPTRYERTLRGRLGAAEASALQARQDAESRVTAALAERDAAITKARTDGDHRLIRAELKALAIQAGIRDPADLVGYDVSALKLTDAGDVDGAAAFIDGLKTAKPHWFSDPASGARTGTTSQTAPAPKPAPTQTKHARDMTADEYQAARAALTRRR